MWNMILIKTPSSYRYKNILSERMFFFNGNLEKIS
jgi:hypothetical protein